MDEKSIPKNSKGSNSGQNCRLNSQYPTIRNAEMPITPIASWYCNIFISNFFIDVTIFKIMLCIELNPHCTIEAMNLQHGIRNPTKSVASQNFLPNLAELQALQV